MSLNGIVVDVELVEDESPLAVDLSPKIVLEDSWLSPRCRDAGLSRSDERLVLPRLDDYNCYDFDRHDDLPTVLHCRTH